MATTTGPERGRPLDLELTQLDEGAERVELEAQAPRPAAAPRPSVAASVAGPRLFSPLAFVVAVLLGAGWLVAGGAARRVAALLLLGGAALALRRAGGWRGAAVSWGVVDALLAPPLALAIHLGVDGAAAGWQRLRPASVVAVAVAPRELAVERLRARLLAEGEAQRVTALEPTVPRGATLNVDGETLLLEAPRCDQALVDGVAARWADELRGAGLRYLRCEAGGRLYEAAIR